MDKVNNKLYFCVSNNIKLINKLIKTLNLKEDDYYYDSINGYIITSNVTTKAVNDALVNIGFKDKDLNNINNLKPKTISIELPLNYNLSLKAYADQLKESHPSYEIVEINTNVKQNKVLIIAKENIPELDYKLANCLMSALSTEVKTNDYNDCHYNHFINKYNNNINSLLKVIYLNN